MLAKRDANVESQILNWISQVTGEKVPSGLFEDALSDGILLCKLMNKLNPGCIPKINDKSSVHFKLVENISNFLRLAEKYGVAEHDLFQTTDLIDKRNIPAVTNCILAVGRACYLHPEFKGPYLGPKPAEANVREWSEEQMKASKGMTAVNI
ncbi:Muscle-specific protein 20-like protein [Leptotrombidium deliense]|uniref:Muscle-specific protein 20-like protein n=1 Tax=Leptotrombidium deliense TaxID=299467 RepID=A0A443SG60_9ACAR|nr:Muscle-specific protein 20-like protein [Leptotrombidium deliense]